jgi:peptidoglycan/xylan/chitin deacetylase (PgdA/CDA1 family)
MVNVIQRMVRSTDATVARVYLSLFRERSALISFLFHSLFRDEREMSLNLINPLQRTTVPQFRQLIEYYLSHGYRFIRPDELLDDRGPDGKCVLLTFDDGYYNNVLALPVLEEYGVHALFFVSTEHVLRNKCYWWDVVYRERMAEGATRRRANRDALAMKSLRTEQIEEELTRRFGPAAFTPRGDIDRPFTPAELRDFARSPYVHLGNHTANHAILTNYDPEAVRDQLRRAQEALRDMTGVTPVAVAYPNGAFSDAVVDACRDVGLRLGFTTRPQKCPLPLGGGVNGNGNGNGHADRFHLSRFIPHGEAPIVAQCRTCRSDFTVYSRFRDLYLKLARPQGVSA